VSDWAPRTENDALIGALADSYLGEQLLPGNFYAFKHADHVTTIDLLDRNLDRPRRKKGTVVVEDAPSFVHYYGRHADADSEVYVNVDSGVITAVLDAHEAGDPEIHETARWGEHRLVLKLKHTTAWNTWTGADRKYLGQVAFGEFIEDNRADIRKPAAADMLEIVQHFQTKTKIQYNSSAVLSNGDKRLVFTEETDAGAGAKGQIEVPTVLELGIAPFEDSQPYVVTARFRYRINGGSLNMGYLLDNADDVRKDAIKLVVDKLAEELGVKVMRGTPA
jgi:uncharacterized protein YfdQ (DUF2303 family)